jgi:hypothetical protein
MGGALLVLIGNAWSFLTTGTADPYALQDYPPIEALPPLFLLLSILGLGIAWRWERLGGTLALVFQVAALPFLFIQSPLTQDFPRFAVPYLLSIIVIIPGVLFLVCWWRSKM